jgi:hypothetical protein
MGKVEGKSDARDQVGLEEAKRTGSRRLLLLVVDCSQILSIGPRVIDSSWFAGGKPR